MKAGVYLLVGSLLTLPGVAMATEEPTYTILSQTEDFELRRYDSQIVAQTWVVGSQMMASNKALEPWLTISLAIIPRPVERVARSA